VPQTSCGVVTNYHRGPGLWTISLPSNSDLPTIRSPPTERASSSWVLMLSSHLSPCHASRDEQASTSDNAGTDVVLGMVPLVRELLRRGTNVVLSANSTPALNDITHPELVRAHSTREVAVSLSYFWRGGRFR
jgi:hypothetical protein